MKKLKIVNNTKGKDTLTRTIRISGENFDKIAGLAEENNTSFNNIVNQIIVYGLNNLDDKNE
ncbi:MAG: hypothetical protein IJ867_07820 [Clostridia bacterium]|nr:hypothetical protein [Clostridia bacterium]